MVAASLVLGLEALVRTISALSTPQDNLQVERSLYDFKQQPTFCQEISAITRYKPCLEGLYESLASLGSEHSHSEGCRMYLDRGLAKFVDGVNSIVVSFISCVDSPILYATPAAQHSI